MGYNEPVKKTKETHDEKPPAAKRDTLFSVTVFLSAFAVNLLIQKLFTTQTLVPMIFAFGVFLISLKTHGYGYGIVLAIVSVFAVNLLLLIPIMPLTSLWKKASFPPQSC